VPYDKLFYFASLPHYQEPAWVHTLVEQGKLPPVEQRLPKKPLVVDTKFTSDGPGQYGGVLRHVIGGRPQGWNWAAGLNQGYGGTEHTTMMCLVRTGPLWMVTPDKIEPLPQLATSWEWSQDGHQLTMHLIEGAKWSDGQPFTSEDVMFLWDDNISDPKVVPGWVRPGAFGEGVKLEALDDYTIRWTFKEAFPIASIYQMALQNMCPAPAHVLKKLHPKYNKDATYDSYINALKPENVPVVTLGPWVPTLYKADQIMVFRRNPYFFEVDDQGNQLPYLDEVQFKLSTWEDRTIQTVAGTADYTNMEDPSLYLESLKKAADPKFPNALYWGPRALSWRLDFNLSTVCGVDNDKVKALRDLFRSFEFRRAVSQGIDREALAQSLVRGPFIAPFPGGLHIETDFFKPESVVYYPYDVPSSKALLKKIGFSETSGDGYLKWSSGPLKGQDVEMTLTFTSAYTTDPAIADTLIGMMRDIGIKLIPQPARENEADYIRDTCKWDVILTRGDRSFTVPIQQLQDLAPLSPHRPLWHQGTADKPQELLPFEPKLIDILNKVRVERDTAKRGELLREYDHIFTENIYNVGLFVVPAALIINKRFRDVPAGAPVLAYQWSEDNVIRERMWIRPEDQGQAPELLPGVLPFVTAK
ncbi:MAG: ABC transporter substrate-binding protein, partial [Methylobacteriaceae bacterium]|nr:ABC transporter substrate-binding protein [Methylobacteriaceae bacterium]